MSSAASNKRKRPLVQHRTANRRLVLVLVVSSVMLWATNAVTMSRASAAPARSHNDRRLDLRMFGLALVLHGRLEILEEREGDRGLRLHPALAGAIPR